MDNTPQNHYDNMDEDFLNANIRKDEDLQNMWIPSNWRNTQHHNSGTWEQIWRRLKPKNSRKVLLKMDNILYLTSSKLIKRMPTCSCTHNKIFSASTYKIILILQLCIAKCTVISDLIRTFMNKKCSSWSNENMYLY